MARDYNLLKFEPVLNLPEDKPLNIISDGNCFAVKDRNGFYYCGLTLWDKQLRKAKLYHKYEYAKEIRDDVRFIEHDTYIVRVRITELNEVSYDE